MNPAHSGSMRAGERGRGLIGFIFALIVVILVGMGMRAYYVVKHRSDVMDEYAYEVIKKADSMKWKADDVRFEIFKKASELGIVMPKAEMVEVVNENAGWRVRFEFEDTIYFPGYSMPYRTKIEKSWTRF